jgi:hypothetical protein
LSKRPNFANTNDHDVGQKFSIQEAMDIILSDLTSSDYFNIVIFSHEIDHWKDESQPVDAESLRDARQFVNQITVRGGEHCITVIIAYKGIVFKGKSL